MKDSEPPASDAAPESPSPAAESASTKSSIASPATAAVASDPAQEQGLVGGLLRFVYWLFWFVALPLAAAVFFVWVLTPAGAADDGGPFGLLTTFVREQPVPVAILSFALAEFAIWPLRFKLPLASYAYQALPEGVPAEARTDFERSRMLLAEGYGLLDRRGERVSAGARAASERALVELQAQLDARPFVSKNLAAAHTRADDILGTHFGTFRKGEGRESMEQLALAILVALVLRAFVFEAFKIPSSSMVPTLQVGDHIFVNKSSYGPRIPFTMSRIWDSMPPRRGDVMVFQFPEKMEQDFIKRVIAIPGDTLEAHGGHPMINGWEVPHCLVGTYRYADQEPPNSEREGELYVEFLEDQAFLTFFDQIGSAFPETQGPFKVAPGEVWVMGDNRHNSQDSRLWWNGKGGGVPFANIKGRALFVWLSVGNSGMDWSRFGTSVMGTPHAPTGFAALEPKIRECLANKPAITTPPPAK